MKSRSSMLFIASVVAAAGGCETGRTDSDARVEFTVQDDSAIRTLNNSELARIRSGDWTAWAGEFTDDAVIQPPNAPALKGRAAIEAWARQMPAVESVVTFDERIEGSGDLAYFTSGFVMKMRNAPPDTSKQLVVFRRTNGAWKAVALSFSSDRPMAAPAGGAQSRR